MTIKAVGDKKEVWAGTAHHTPGGLTKSQLTVNARGKVVSVKMQKRGAALMKALKAAGYEPFKKGSNDVRRRR